MQNPKGIILCGGKGKRLRPLTYYFQKSTIPIGPTQKPVLEYIIRLLKHHKVADIHLLVNYKYEQIMNYFDNGERFGVRLTYIQDSPDYQGNLGALYNAYNKGHIKPDETLLVYYGDILSNIDLSRLVKEHRKHGAKATVALSSKYPVPVGVAEITEKDRITKFVEKPELGKPVSIAILALESNTLRDAPKITERGEIDIFRDLIPHLIKRGELVYPYITDAFWYDVGSLEKYEKLSNATIESQLGFLFKPQKMQVSLSSRA